MSCAVPPASTSANGNSTTLPVAVLQTSMPCGHFARKSSRSAVPCYATQSVARRLFPDCCYHRTAASSWLSCAGGHRPASVDSCAQESARCLSAPGSFSSSAPSAPPHRSRSGPRGLIAARLPASHWIIAAGTLMVVGTLLFNGNRYLSPRNSLNWFARLRLTGTWVRPLSSMMATTFSSTRSISTT